MAETRQNSTQVEVVSDADDPLIAFGKGTISPPDTATDLVFYSGGMERARLGVDGAATGAFGGSLTATAVKTSAYAAAAGDFVPVDVSSAAVTVTLPTAPADGVRVGVKTVAQASANQVTINCGGTDVFNKAGGATTATLYLLNQALILHYKASTGIWYVEGDDLPLSQLDSRFAAKFGVEHASRLLKNQLFASVMASPPTITIGAANAATQITGSVLTGPTDTRFRYECKLTRQIGGPTYYGAQSETQVGGFGSSGEPWRICFDAEVDKFEFKVDANACLWRMYVDDQPIAASPTTMANDSSDRLVLVDFGARGYHRIMIEGETSFFFGGVRLHPTGTLSAPTIPQTIRFGWLGDSFGIGGGASFNFNGFVYAVARGLGWAAPRNFSVSGTGVRKTSGNGLAYPTRIADLAASPVDVLVIAQSLNDGIYAGTLTPDWLSYLPLVRQSLPAAKILMTSVLTPAAPTGTLAQVSADGKAAYDQLAASLGLTKYIDTSAWFTGTGKVGATAGDGNADFYRNNDGVHPSDDGHAYYARRFINEISAGLGLAGY